MVSVRFDHTLYRKGDSANIRAHVTNYERGKNKLQYKKSLWYVVITCDIEIFLIVFNVFEIGMLE